MVSTPMIWQSELLTLLKTVYSSSGAACSCFTCDWSFRAPPPVSTSPEAADSSSFDVQLGDIILTASDGLFDNMPDYMILQELKKLKVALLLMHAFTYTMSHYKVFNI